MVEKVIIRKNESRSSRGLHWSVDVTQDGITAENYFEDVQKAAAFMEDFVSWHIQKGFMK